MLCAKCDSEYNPGVWTHGCPECGSYHLEIPDFTDEEDDMIYDWERDYFKGVADDI